ncbi:MAG: hypothetical protein ACT4PT_01415 [Methanobacteriota archaeon]
MTRPLWLSQPSPRTARATVTGVRGPSFTLDRSIFSPGLSEYGHPQPADRGEVWLGGDKRILRRVAWSRGELLLTLDGAVPAAGSEARCLLDAERRTATEETHTAMHLVLSALARGSGPVLSGSAHVQGGGHFAFDATRASFRPEHVAEGLRAANRAAARGLPVGVEYVARDMARDLDGERRESGIVVPGPADTVRVVRIGDASAMACDGTFRPSTAGLPRIVLAAARPKGTVVTLQFRLEP